MITDERYLIAEQIMDMIEFELSIIPKINMSKKVLTIWKFLMFKHLKNRGALEG